MFSTPDSGSPTTSGEMVGDTTTTRKSLRQWVLPTDSRNGRQLSLDIQPEGESGRTGFHPVQFCKVAWRGSCKASIFINILWPIVPVAIGIPYMKRRLTYAIFVTNYIAMLPAAHLLGFASQELCRKLPGVLALLLEITFGSVVELILFMVLITHKTDNSHHYPIVIKAAILGSILANLLLCLGLCCFLGGLRRREQHFHETVSEVASGLLFVAGFALLIPSAFYSALKSSAFGPNAKMMQENSTSRQEFFTLERLDRDTLAISRGTAFVLFLAYFLYLYYNLKSHEGVFNEVLVEDEAKNANQRQIGSRAKFTMTEAVMALAVAIALVSVISIMLVGEIEPLVSQHGIPDDFMGLILVPLAEKASEHLTAINKAWDDQMNSAVFHCLGSSIQTALFNAPLVVMVGWGLGKDSMNLNFEIFQVAVLLLAVIVVGNFVRDKKSNYLEGGLLVLIYVIIGVTAWFYPASSMTRSNTEAWAMGPSAMPTDTLRKEEDILHTP